MIALFGPMGSGKSTVAQMLEDHGYRKVALAGTLKDMVAIMFGWDRQMLEGETYESRQWREQVDPHWTSILKGKGIFHDTEIITPRLVLQRIGTHLVREHVHTDFWIESALRRLDHKTVIPDLRFWNEYTRLRERGCIMIRIEGRGQTSSDITERDWKEFPYDFLIDNSGNLERLRQQVEGILKRVV